MSASRPPTAAAPPVVAVLLPIVAVVVIAFLVIGLALPVLPLHMQRDLGLGTFAVGLVADGQFARRWGWNRWAINNFPNAALQLHRSVHLRKERA